MQDHDPYFVIHEHLAAGEQPTISEIVELLKVDEVALAVFQAGSIVTIAYLLQRIGEANQRHDDTMPPED